MKKSHISIKRTIFCLLSHCVMADLYPCKRAIPSPCCIFVVPDPSVRPTLLTSSQSATEASETLLYEKWSSTSFFDITLSVTRRLESEGGALWRKHSCSGHLYQSCNLHWNHTTLRVGENIFFHSALRDKTKQTSQSRGGGTVK